MVLFIEKRTEKMTGNIPDCSNLVTSRPEWPGMREDVL